MTLHARLSASNAYRWMRCPGSPGLEAQCADRGSVYAAEGTAAHALAALCLTTGRDIESFAGQRIEGFEVDREMISAVGKYLEAVASWTEGTDHILLVEQKVPIDQLTGEKDAKSTADAITIDPDGSWFRIADLKYGRGVEVGAENNEQLMIYALGTLEVIRSMGFEPVRATLTICQPRLNPVPDEWEITVQDLEQFGWEVSAAVGRVVQHPDDLVPGEKQCRFCAAKAHCSAFAAFSLGVVADDFVDLSRPVAPQLEGSKERVMDLITLGNCMSAVDLVEVWCRAIRARVETELLQGQEVPGWKLVQGRRGNRAWADKEIADTVLEVLLGDARYAPRVLLSPTQAEKLLPKGQTLSGDLVVQPEGKPSVVAAIDPRPAIDPGVVVDDFAVVAE